ncbi:thioredoxin domain-containing protein [Corynebacterium sp.]|uniref:DsbA family protein n=1 Tax=Corynebacterium sp. TaxID=1720 RepID=UPI0026DB309F|nr:thioredoxin domain-containing protein [Corynebacterium sp.]MDO5031893.1 thioredoxin domain-containing protein [Corynebacterium sp.]
MPISYDEPISSDSKKSALSTINPLVWALLAIIVVLALVVGLLLGERNSGEDSAAQGEAASTSAPAQDAAHGAGQDSGQDSKQNSAAQATPGTKFADGSGDPMIFGPGKDVRSTTDVTAVHRRKDNDPFAIGAVDAPVVISEFSDFECPFCSRHTNATEPTLLKEYVDKGLVRIEWNDFPVNGPAAVEAAKAGRAAAAQGKFIEFKHELYTASKDIKGHPEFDIEDFVGFAEKAGVKDVDTFRAQATDGTYEDVVKKATAYAAQIGITGTPAFVVGDQFISGAQPLEVFEQVIDEQLKKAANA